MAKATLVLLVIFLLGCEGRHAPHPPPPPPPPGDPQGNGPAAVPAEISAFLQDRKDVSVVLYRLEHANGSGSGSFHGWHIAESRELSAPMAAETADVLANPRSYTDHHILCTDLGVGVRLRRGGATLDLMIGLVCRHVHRAASGEEIGSLSTSGQEFFVQLARHVSPRR